VDRYDGHKWIRVKRHTHDPDKSWEDNYRDLDRHHVAETSFLIDEVRKLAAELVAIRTQRPSTT
jgi:hypothetical protein